MRAARWTLAAVSLLLVALLTWRDLHGTGGAPGPLHPAHAAAAGLDGGARCAGCHSAGAGLDAAACGACHAAIAAQLADGRGLHGSLPADRRARCGDCHTDHHGAAAPLLGPAAFARAGVPDPAAYRHEHVPFGLGGRHLGLACEQCHRAAKAMAPPPGGRYLGLRQDCTSCHDDAHRGAFGADCRGCHGESEPFRAAPGFAHAALPLAGAHRAVACTACHPAGSARSVEAARAAPPAPRGCADCHADPHGGPAARPGALALAGAADCARCHPATAWAAARPDPAAHAAHGFPLRGAHAAAAACVACHGDAAAGPRWAAGAAPAPAGCARCHGDPHLPGFTAAAVAAVGPADGCAGCHRDADASFAIGQLPVALHAAAGMALVAPHAEVACRSCHTGPDHASRFPGRHGADCAACHRDPHGGQFAAAGGAAPPPCTACHAATAFAPPQFGAAAHAATGFPLRFAHDAVGCHACHGEVAGGVRRFRGTPRDCAACHRDPHRGAFDRPGLPAHRDGRAGCARCHDERAFAPVAAGFDHALWTGYELVGAHGQVACAACHPRAAAGGAAGAAPRLGPAAGRGCADCHRDPHGGQFAAGDGRTDCARCHSAEQFAPARFDHQRQSRFQLDAVHAALPCAACHRAEVTAAGPVVRYRPLGTRCGDCHTVGGRQVPR